jgi:hypothetical protein
LRIKNNLRTFSPKKLISPENLLKLLNFQLHDLVVGGFLSVSYESSSKRFGKEHLFWSDGAERSPEGASHFRMAVIKIVLLVGGASPEGYSPKSGQS